eukprot:1194944-Prorocentrum_minimum.AAC.2
MLNYRALARVSDIRKQVTIAITPECHTRCPRVPHPPPPSAIPAAPERHTRRPQAPHPPRRSRASDGSPH